MAITFIQTGSHGAQRGGAGSVDKISASFASSVTAGNVLVIFTTHLNTGQTVTWTDTKGGNTYTKLTSSFDVGASQDSELWYSTVTNGGTGFGVTMSLSPTSDYMYMIIAEYGGVAALPIDVYAMRTQAGSTTTNAMRSPQTTSHADGETLVGGAVDIIGSAVITPGTGWTNRGMLDDGTNITLMVEDIVQPTQGLTGSFFTFGTANVGAISFVALKKLIQFNLSGSDLDFGSILVTQYSAKQSYEVTCSDTTDIVAISSSAPFLIATGSSPALSEYSYTASCPQSNPSGTINVIFNPLVLGIYSQSVTHSSAGATTVYRTISGTGLDTVYSSISGQGTISGTGTIGMR